MTSKVFTRQFLEFLTNALALAKTMINLDDHDKKIIHHSRKSLLFNQEQTWMKKGSDLFDVSMGASDGREVCELIGIFLLNLLRRQSIQKTLAYIETMDFQCLRTAVVRKWNRLRNTYKK